MGQSVMQNFPSMDPGGNYPAPIGLSGAASKTAGTYNVVVSAATTEASAGCST